MKVYAVFEPRRRGDDLAQHAERFRFVRDGFSFPAFIFGPLWMLRHRLWLAFVVYLIIAVGLATAVYLRAIPVGAETAIIVMLALLIGMEASTLRRRKLLWWRWRDAGIVVAKDILGAEQRFFDHWTARTAAGATDVAPTVIAPQAAPAAVSGTTADASTDSGSYVVGFPPPGGTR